MKPILRVLCLGIFAGLLIRCSESTEPVQPGSGANPTPISVNDTITSRFLSTDSVHRYLFQDPTGGDAAIFFQCFSDTFLLKVEASPADPRTLVIAPTDADPSHLTLNRTEIFSFSAGEQLQVRVAPLRPPGSSKYRFWVYRPNHAPEHAPPVVSPDDTVSSEDLENSADIDEFEVTVGANQEYVGYLQSLDSLGAGGIAMFIRSTDDQATFASVASGSKLTDFEIANTGRFSFPAAGTYRIRINGGADNLPPPFDGKLPYRFQLRRVERLPEHAAVALPENDTLVTEALDYLGDVDDFTFDALQGEEYILFYRAPLGPDVSGIRVELPGLADLLGNYPWTSATDPTPIGRTTGRFQIPATGRYHVTVFDDAQPRDTLTRGTPYKLLLVHVKRSPETVSPTPAIGDSIAGEAIDFPGDVDQYQLSLQSPTLVNFIVWRPSAVPGVVRLALDGGDPIIVAAQPNPIVGLQSGAGSGRILLGAGTHAVRIDDGPDLYQGPYGLQIIPIDTMPEGVPANFAQDEIVQETIAPVGDIDGFSFTAAADDLIDLQLQGIGAAVGAGIVDAAHTWGGVGVSSVALAPSLTAHRSGRVTLPLSGTYRLTVDGEQGGKDPIVSGAYRFRVRSLDRQPEHVGPVLALGDTMRSEPLDQRGDVDEFQVSAAPGSLVQVLVENLSGGGTLQVDVVDGVTVQVLGSALSSIAEQAVGRRLIPGSGLLRVRVFEPRQADAVDVNAAFGMVGPYTVRVVQIQTTPESVAPVIALGDTIQGEAIEPIGDIDEFDFAGHQGQVVAGSIQVPGGFGSTIRLEIIDPGSGQVLGTAITADATWGSSGPLALTATQNYRVRIEGLDDRAGKGAYRFLIQ